MPLSLRSSRPSLVAHLGREVRTDSVLLRVEAGALANHIGAVSTYALDGQLETNYAIELGLR